MLVNTETRTPSMFDFRRKMVGLPSQLTKYNATYTRNSLKHVVQDGVLVQLAANQFGTSYDDVTGLYGYVPEPAATNLLWNSGFSGATTPPTNYLQPIAEGSSVFTTTTLGTRGISIAVAGGRNFITSTISVSASTTYTVSLNVYVSSGSITAENVLRAVSLPSGATVSYPVCSANPIGSASGVIVTGLLVIHIVAAATAGVVQIRMGVGALGSSTASLTITTPQAETGLRATSWILTPTGATATRAADVLRVPLWVNNLKDSQDGSTANWTRTNCTVVTSGTAPDGTSTAQLLTVSTTATTVFYSTGQKAPASTVTASVYIKQGNRATCQVLLRNDTTATNFQIGSLTFATGVITGAGWTAESVGNGWYRCKYTQSTGINVGDALHTYINHLGDTPTAGDTVYFWGAQIEAGSTATAYRPTVSRLEYSRNLLDFSDGNASTYTISNVVGGVPVSGFTNGIAFGDNSVQRNAHKYPAMVAGVTYTFSVYIAMDDGGAPNVGTVSTSGDLSLRNGATEISTTPAVVTSVGSGIYRVSVTDVCAGSSAVGVWKYTSQSARTFRVTGWQLVSGSSPLDYEPTNTMAASANANIPGFNVAGYTLFADGRHDVNTSINRGACAVSDNTSNNIVMLRKSAANAVGMAVNSSAVMQAAIVMSDPLPSRFKAATSTKADMFRMALSGVGATADTSGAMPVQPLTLLLGSQSTIEQFNGYLFRAGLIPQALTQAQINALTVL